MATPATKSLTGPAKFNTQRTGSDEDKAGEIRRRDALEVFFEILCELWNAFVAGLDVGEPPPAIELLCVS